MSSSIRTRASVFLRLLRKGSAKAVAMALTVASIAVAESPAADWYVDGNDPNCSTGTGGPGDPFCTITAAIVAAADGDTIHIAPATYIENLVLDKNLTLLGFAGDSVTIVDGSVAGSVVCILPSRIVQIGGLTLTRGKADCGGGIDVRTDAVLTLRDATLIGNQANRGGGLCNAGMTTVSSTTFSANDSSSHGGGFANEPQGEMEIHDSLFERNTALASGGGFCNLYISKSLLYDCVLRENQSSACGGGGFVDCDSRIELHRCQVLSNSAACGGGIGNPYDGSVVIVDSIIADNSATSDGGGIINGGGTSVLGSVLLRNRASGDGGGLYTESHDPARGFVSLFDSIVRDNQAVGDGGGLYFHNFDAGVLQLERSEVSRNHAGQRGGGVHVEDDVTQATLVSGTIAGNTALHGGGIHSLQGATVDCAGTILAANSASTGPDCEGALVSSGYNLIGNTSDCTISGDQNGNLLDLDPRFRDPLSGDFALQFDSPCVDAADPSLTLGGRDLADNPRELDGDLDRLLRVDIGAYEFDHVHLEVTGSATPGGSLTLDTTGTVGLSVYLFVGVSVRETAMPPYGALFVDLAAPWYLMSLGSIPDQRVLDVPGNLSVPADFVLQEIALRAPSMPGNLSNVVNLHIE